LDDSVKTYIDTELDDAIESLSAFYDTKPLEEHTTERPLFPPIKSRNNLPTPTDSRPAYYNTPDKARLFTLPKTQELPAISTAQCDLDRLLEELDDIDSGVQMSSKYVMVSPVDERMDCFPPINPTLDSMRRPQVIEKVDVNTRGASYGSEKVKRGGFLGFLKKGIKRDSSGRNAEDRQVGGVTRDIKKNEHRMCWRNIVGKDKDTKLPVIQKYGR